MNRIAFAALAAGLAAGTMVAHAEDFPDDTIVRGVTIAPPGSPMGDNRVILSTTLPMGDCKKALPQMIAEQKPEDDGIIFACFPLDMLDIPEGAVIPMMQYTAE